jgi:hypothetical protein
LSIRQSARGLEPHHSKEIQYNEYDGDDEQDVDHVAGLRETRADAPAEKAEQPQHDQNHDDSPQHEISPFE